MIFCAVHVSTVAYRIRTQFSGMLPSSLHPTFVEWHECEEKRNLIYFNVIEVYRRHDFHSIFGLDAVASASALYAQRILISFIAIDLYRR